MKKTIILSALLLLLGCSKKDYEKLAKHCSKSYTGDTVSVGYFGLTYLYNCDNVDLTVMYGGKRYEGADTLGDFFFSVYNGFTDCNLRLNKDTVIVAPNGMHFHVKFTNYYTVWQRWLDLYTDSGWVFTNSLHDSSAKLYIKALE